MNCYFCGQPILPHPEFPTITRYLGLNADGTLHECAVLKPYREAWRAALDDTEWLESQIRGRLMFMVEKKSANGGT